MDKSNIVSGRHAPEKRQAAYAMRRSMTPAERLLWTHLRANRLDGLHFRRQQVIDGFIVDFYCHAAGLVVEVDGPVHAEQTDYDAERDRVLAARGLLVLRFSNDRVRYELKTVLHEILSAARFLTPLWSHMHQPKKIAIANPLGNSVLCHFF